MYGGRAIPSEACLAGVVHIAAPAYCVCSGVRSRTGGYGRRDAAGGDAAQFVGCSLRPNGDYDRFYGDYDRKNHRSPRFCGRRLRSASGPLPVVYLRIWGMLTAITRCNCFVARVKFREKSEKD